MPTITTFPDCLHLSDQNQPTPGAGRTPPWQTCYTSLTATRQLESATVTSEPAEEARIHPS